MSGAKKLFLIILGALSALLIVGQLVMGQLIVSGNHEPAAPQVRTSTPAI